MADEIDYNGIADQLGLNEPEEAPKSTYWGHLEGDDLAAAIVDRHNRHREWLESNGLLQGWKLKLCYFHSEFRASPEVPHLNILQQWGAQGEFTSIGINHLRSILKTLLGSIIQNPQSYTCLATNADASALESSALYQGVLSYYIKLLRINSKIAAAVERAIVVDQGFIMVEWDAFATDGEAPANSSIWKGVPSVKVLFPWDVSYDVCKNSWEDLDWVVVRDWVDREKAKSQFPEFADDIEASSSRAQITQANSVREPNRYDLNSFSDMSNDIQVFKFFHRPQPWMPNGRFCMALESGKLMFESPVGLMYPKLPVERMVCDDQTDMLLGHSPINEMLCIQESINSIESAINSNALNYSNQYIACVSGTEINPRTLADGQKIIEYPPGSAAPVGLNLTAIPNTLFEHIKSLEDFMQTIPGVSNASRGQAGNNQTGSAMAFLQTQTANNNGQMTQNYSDFAASVMTSLLHVLRVFGRTEKTINIMGKTVASRTIVMADALKDFDEVTVVAQSPIMATPAGRMQFAQSMMQFGNATPQAALEVATSGNLGPVTDPAQENEFELNLENEWLLQGEQILVNALDDHESHIKMHTRLFATPWLRKPDLAAKLGIQNAPQIMQTVMDHVQKHMSYLSQNSVNATQTTAGVAPGAPKSAPSPALGHPPAAGSPAQPPPNAPAGISMPSMPGQPAMPR